MAKKTTKKSKELTDKKVFYVGIDDGIPVRKSILESSRELVQSLQQYDKFTSVRAHKREIIIELKVLLDTCATDINKLKRMLPTLQGYKPPVPKVEKEAPIESKPVKTEPKLKLGKEAKSELAQLEKELSDIESKLSSM